MKNKNDVLQQALKQGSGRSAADEKTSEPDNVTPMSKGPERQGRQPDRAGKTNISAWLDQAYARSLLMVRAATGKKSGELLAEALNDLFAKYDVPQIRED